MQKTRVQFPAPMYSSASKSHTHTHTHTHTYTRGIEALLHLQTLFSWKSQSWLFGVLWCLTVIHIGDIPCKLFSRLPPQLQPFASPLSGNCCRPYTNWELQARVGQTGPFWSQFLQRGCLYIDVLGRNHLLEGEG